MLFFDILLTFEKNQQKLILTNTCRQQGQQESAADFVNFVTNFKYEDNSGFLCKEPKHGSYIAKEIPDPYNYHNIINYEF